MSRMIATIIGAFFVAISFRGTMGDQSSPIHRILSTGDDEAEWTYRSTQEAGTLPYGPSDWFLGYPDCAGKEQSPINLSGAYEEAENWSSFDLAYSPMACPADELVFIADGFKWQVAFDGCSNTSSLMFDGDKYNLLQLHLHSLSEHTVGGANREAEIHFVHVREGSDADLLVVGILVEVSDFNVNHLLESYWGILDEGTETIMDRDEDFFVASPYELLPAGSGFSHYFGSLTTPPCTEGVKWIVMDESIFMSTYQLTSFRTSVARASESKVDELGNTNRPTLPINDRVIYHVTSP